MCVRACVCACACAFACVYNSVCKFIQKVGLNSDVKCKPLSVNTAKVRYYLCVCARARARERERVCVCVCAYTHIHTQKLSKTHAYVNTQKHIRAYISNALKYVHTQKRSTSIASACLRA
jgi:hypothetical protein